MATASFFFSIFKRLQVCDSSGPGSPGIINLTTNPRLGGHFTPPQYDFDSENGLSGGFRLTHPSCVNGMIGGTILASTPSEPMQAWNANLQNQPVLTGSTVPKENPLYVMLSTCVGANAPNEQGVTTTPSDNLSWPPMPNFCQVIGGNAMIPNAAWNEFTSSIQNPTVIEALGTWIENGQINDEPQQPSPLFYPTLTQNPPAPFPNLPADTTILFMCSQPGDNGRRPGDPIPVAPIADYWVNSLIFLTNNKGVQQPTSANLIGSASDVEYYVAAAIGNSGNINAGRLPAPPPPAVLQPSIAVLCYAMVFNSGFGPAVPLPALSNLDGNDTNPIYEQFFLAQQFYDVVGFRFNVNSVFSGLVTALQNANMNLGEAAAEAWLEGGHACVKVLILNGETPSVFPANLPPTSVASNPAMDRHIAQKNLGQFQILSPLQQIKWTNFIVAQAPVGGTGLNRLQIQHASLPDTFGFLLAMPTQPFEDYVRKDGGIEGFEVVRDASSKPFPDAVILRETRPGSFLEIASHEREPFLGMSFGVEYDRPKLAPGPIGTVSVVHFTNDNEVFGGFTLEVEMAAARQ